LGELADRGTVYLRVRGILSELADRVELA
jgi:hypothetical protein